MKDTVTHTPRRDPTPLILAPDRVGKSDEMTRGVLASSKGPSPQAGWCGQVPSVRPSHSAPKSKLSILLRRTWFYYCPWQLFFC